MPKNSEWNGFNKRIKVQNGAWLTTHKEYLSWRKTTDFDEWKRRQFLRQGGTCYYCDIPLKGMRINVEHIMPKARGGSNERNNLVLACNPCNKSKNISVLSQKKRCQLKIKNNEKKGSYHVIASHLKTEEEAALELREMFKED